MRENTDQNNCRYGYFSPTLLSQLNNYFQNITKKQFLQQLKGPPHKWLFKQRHTKETSSNKKQQQVTMSGTMSDGEWQLVTKIDNKWQQGGTTNSKNLYNKWQWVTTRDTYWIKYWKTLCYPKIQNTLCKTYGLDINITLNSELFWIFNLTFSCYIYILSMEKINKCWRKHFCWSLFFHKIVGCNLGNLMYIKSDYGGQDILKLFDILPIFCFSTRKTACNY